ncbi:uncharacterized protein EDB93DRAFT_1186252 [Suillus bovinus]|uniref:uncharacterized protein n=1 Tax=Suillus bovinus TaxID=48563 RepID=UPI001B874A97|nr:uncharacterized protein EDB93DRAFT_1186252 [Suillus bovinus]KAG2127625.1 hypothetical protein EDB93DRAFT_1186252 [Suillus bovinus]
MYIASACLFMDTFSAAIVSLGCQNGEHMGVDLHRGHQVSSETSLLRVGMLSRCKKPDDRFVVDDARIVPLLPSSGDFCLGAQ